MMKDSNERKIIGNKNKGVTVVFWFSLCIAAAFILWSVFLPNNAGTVLGAIFDYITNSFAWIYPLAMAFFLLFTIFLAFGPYGKIKLGKPDEKPKYNFFTWFAFLFSTGMGVSLVFYGIAEPMYHFYDPPRAEAGTLAAAEDAIMYALFHQGLHPWATYAVVGVTIAYFKYRHDGPALISSAFTLLLGKYAKGRIGNGIDSLGVIATVFGITTSLGLGAMQISAGLNSGYEGVQNTVVTQLIVIGVLTALFITSATTGVDRGMRYLSWVNIVVAICLMLFVFFIGSTTKMVDSFLTTVGNYLQDLPLLTFTMNAFTGERDFLNAWTLFYWAWWIGWAPFVGTFLARVSRGRTIREFAIGVTAIPSLLCAIWFSVFGIAGMDFDNASGGLLYNLMVTEGPEAVMFAFLESMPFTFIITGITVLLLGTFFVTSADSGTYVLGMLTTGGSLNPFKKVKIVWGLVIAVTASVLLLSGGLTALQTAMLIAAFPFAFVVILMGVSLVKALRNEHEILHLESKQRDYDSKYHAELDQVLVEKRMKLERILPDVDVETEDIKIVGKKKQIS